MAKKQLSKEIIRQLNDAWLNIDSNTPIINPFERLKTEDPEEFYKRLTCLFLNPDYIYFVCKHVLNVELLPMQALILQEMWQRKFPMLVATRGFGKTFLTSLYCLLRALLIPGRKIVVVGAAFRQSKFLHEYMANIWKNAPILRDMCTGDSGPRASVDMCRMIINDSVITALPIGDGCLSPDTLTTYENRFGTIIDSKDNTNRIWGNGKFRGVDYFIDNGVKPTKKITTKKGFEFECTHNHAMKVIRDGNIQWCRSDQMIIGDRILIDRSIRWHSGNFECSEDQAYSLGAMIGDGCWTNKYSLGFASKDPEIVSRLSSGLNETTGKSFNQVEKDPVHFKLHGMNYVSKFLNFWGLKEKCYTIDKELPPNILSAPQNAMTACIQGLFDTDGHVTSSTAKGGISVSVNFTNTSKNLVRQLQYILLHYGIISKVTSRQRKTWNRVYQLGIYGNNAVIFAEKIGFSLPRKQTELLKSISLKSRSMSFDEDIPISTDLVLSSINRSNSVPEKFARSKLSKRKSLQRNLLKDLVQYCDNPDWLNLLNDSVFYDEIASIEDSESYTCDIHVPEDNEYCANGCFSHNSKIRGQRAHDIIADEFASHSREIFENVIAGFAAVSANPVDNVKAFAKQEAAKKLGIDLEEYSEGSKESLSNQIVLSGTAYYDFNHFAEYWKKWKAIIQTGGDQKSLSTNIFNGEPVPESFNWKDYSIIRVPVDLIPRRFMDEGQIARSKATLHNGLYMMEFAACFSKDSQGFFKRSLIESCVGTDSKPVHIGDESIYFDPLLKGNKNRKYVMAVDPASEVDNFSIIILELHGTHRRIVHCWTTTRSDHTEKVAKGITKVNNFYSYCARKIRDLMKLFNIAHIAMDSQGGGYSVSEALHDLTQLEHGEIPIWPIIDPEKEAPTDDQSGLHILEMCQFANYEWYSEANHGLRKDLENKTILFPRFDPITIGLSIEEDSANNRLYDTLEDCVMEIEELKNELSMIEITQSVNGRERWDTPETKVGVSKKRRLRKDRYSALIMANLSARKIDIDAKPSEYHSYGGFSSRSEGKKQEGATYEGPNWFTSKVNNLY